MAFTVIYNTALHTFGTLLACCEINQGRLQAVRDWFENVVPLSACVDEFNIYTREAGAGTVSVSIEGPSKAKIDMVDRHCGYLTVAYVVSQPGNQNG